ncbi:MAG: RNB domain-containing ribonuclease [Treponema sp.]|jgi:exoribonuclease-2|nr:RNB domain-containing ribonuclease [Treponema sp.]
MEIAGGALAVYKNRPALVAETGEKITIALPGGERIKVRPKDIEILHAGPLKSLDELAVSAAAETAEAETADAENVRGAWELLAASGGTTTLAELAELAFGGFTPHSAWKAFTLFSDGLYFTGTLSALAPRGAEEVAAETAKRQGKKNEALAREAFLRRLRAGTPHGGDSRFMQDVEALAYGKSEKSRTLRDLGKSETPEEAHRFLLGCGVWDCWINPHPQRWGIALTQPALTGESAADRLPRRDLTSLASYAIDSPWSTDPDDAVSLETEGGKTLLYVHVADPASAISRETEAESRARGATLYAPEGIVRMLPEELLARYSLGLAETSPALTFRLTLDPAHPAFIETTEIFPSTVRVTRLSYEEADAKSGDPALAALFALGRTNFERRLAAGAVNIELPETHITVNPGRHAISIAPVHAWRSADMVRECMLLAGEGAAAWAEKRQLPFPCITQEAGDLPARPLEGLAGSYQLRRCMRPRRVSAKSGCHWGLGLAAYTQVTSPLRRYTDLLAHLQLRACLDAERDGPGPLDEDELLLRLAAADAAAQRVTGAERASKAHWTAVYLDQMLRTKEAERLAWEAVVCEKGKNSVTVIIPDLAWETKVGGAGGEPGDTIKLRLVSVAVPEAEAVFSRR